MASPVLCFADAASSVGSGHVFRVYPVTVALHKLRVKNILCCPLAKKNLKALKVPSGTSCNAKRFTTRVRRMNPAAVLLDTYREYDFLLKNAALIPHAVFDDHYRPPKGIAMLVNASPSASVRYGKNGPFKKLLGPRYASLHPAFRMARPTFRVRTRVQKILVALGGNDTRGNLPKIVASLRKTLNDAELIVCGAPDCVLPKDKKIRRRPWLGQEQMAREFAQCDLAVLAGGQMLVQAACIGIPALSIPQTSNQREHASAWEKIGSVLVLKNSRLLKEALQEVSKLQTRRKMAKTGRSAVDGRGAERIARALIGLAYG